MGIHVIYTCTFMRIYMHTDPLVQSSEHVSVYRHHTHKYVCICIYAYMHMYICIYVDRVWYIPTD